MVEYLSDRWERASGSRWGEGASIYHLSYVFGEVSVGEHTWIGPYTLLDGSGGLRIGSWCSISTGTQIYSHNTVKWAVSGGAADYDHAATSIGDQCFIGPYCVIAMGVTIGRQCVVGAHSFVNKDLPDRTIAVGTPARAIGRVEQHDDGEIIFAYE